MNAQRSVAYADDGLGGQRRPGRRSLRFVVSLCTVVGFIVASTLIGMFVLPLTLFAREPSRKRAHTVRLNRGLGWFARLLRKLGLLHFDAPHLPERLNGRGFLLVSNHPTLLDVVLLLGAVPELTCVVKQSWYRSPILHLLLRLTDYIVVAPDDHDAGLAPVLRHIESALSRGQPVLVFPEGTRSPWRSVHRFRRGALEAAVRAAALVQPIVTTVDRPFLSHGRRMWDVPDDRPRYSFEWLETIDPCQVAGGSRAIARTLTETYRARLSTVEQPCAFA